MIALVMCLFTAVTVTEFFSPKELIHHFIIIKEQFWPSLKCVLV